MPKNRLIPELEEGEDLYDKPSFFDRDFITILFLFMILFAIVLMFFPSYDDKIYNEKVCFQSFPTYCEYEIQEQKENGLIKNRPVIPGLMMFQDNKNYSNRRIPQFNFEEYVEQNFTVRYCKDLTWVNVPCEESHLIETSIKAENKTVYWWEKYVIPGNPKVYPVNKDD